MNGKDTNSLVANAWEWAQKDEATKDDFDRLKTALEIQQLAVPWWKRPGYLGILLPTLIALASVFVAVANGVFSFELHELDVKKDKLGIDIARLELDKKRNQWDVDKFAETKARLEKEASELTSSNKMLESDRSKLVKEKTNLSTKVGELTAEKANLEGGLVNLNRQMTISQLRLQIDLLARDSSPISNGKAENEFVTTMKQDTKSSLPYLDEVLAELKDNSQFELRARIACLMYLGAQDGHSREFYLTEINKELNDGGRLRGDLGQHVFTRHLLGRLDRRFDYLGSMPDKDRAMFCSALIELVAREVARGKSSTFVNEELYLVARAMGRGNVESSFKCDLNDLLTAIELSRDVFTKDERVRRETLLEKSDPIHAIRPALSSICPRAFVMVLWSWMVQADEITKRTLRESEYQALLVEYERSPRLKRALDVLDVPRTFDEQVLIEWRNRWKRELEWWMEDGLKSLRKDRVLLQALLNEQ